MDPNYFVDKDSIKDTSKPFNANTKGSGCLSSLVISWVFGILVAGSLYSVGYSTSTAIMSGVATSIGILLLHLSVTILYLGFFGLIALLFAGFIYSNRKK